MSWLTDFLTSLPTVANLLEKNRVLTAEKAAADDEIAFLKDENRKLRSEVQILDEKLKQSQHNDVLDGPQVEILTLIAQGGRTFEKAEMEALLEFQRTHLDYHVQELIDKDYVKMYRPSRTRPAKYGLTQRGRDYALKNNLA